MVRAEHNTVCVWQSASAQWDRVTECGGIYVCCAELMEEAPVEAASEYVKDGPMPGGATGEPRKKVHGKESFDPPPLFDAIWVYLSFALVTLVGHIRDILMYVGLKKTGSDAAMLQEEDMFKLNQQFERFYTRHAYTPIRDCWERPICSLPGARIDVMDRVSSDGNWTYTLPGTKKNCLNLGSYNYLGFAENSGPCTEAVKETMKCCGVACCSARGDYGNLPVVRELECAIARFVGKQDAIVFGMGFATNSTNMRALVSKGCLLISDEINHTSLILGARLTGATIRLFKHGDMADLERLLRQAVVEGQPRTHRPWKKILIVVEGIYSMEGSIINLPEVIALKKKYKAYVYLDEAHSIGAVGETGRGVVEYCGVDPADVDIMMGTFTKSFGSAGGYIAANYDIINHLRSRSHSAVYAPPMAPPVAQQVISVLRILSGEDGTDTGKRRIKALAENVKYFRQRLVDMGFNIYGNEDSAVVPILVYYAGKFATFSRMLLEDNIAVVVVGFPAVPVLVGRARVCLSAAHTREMLDEALERIEELGDFLSILYKKKKRFWLF